MWNRVSDYFIWFFLFLAMLGIGLFLMCIDMPGGFSIRNLTKEYKQVAAIAAACSIGAFIALQFVKRFRPTLLHRSDPIEADDYIDDPPKASIPRSQAPLGDGGARSSASMDRPLHDKPIDS